MRRGEIVLRPRNSVYIRPLKLNPNFPTKEAIFYGLIEDSEKHKGYVASRVSFPDSYSPVFFWTWRWQFLEILYSY